MKPLMCGKMVEKLPIFCYPCGVLGQKGARTSYKQVKIGNQGKNGTLTTPILKTMIFPQGFFQKSF